MTNAPLMPMATAVWLVENTTLTFKQIADFCNLHEVEVQGIADGEVAKGIKAYNPIISGQLSREEIELSSKDQLRPLEIKNTDIEISNSEKKMHVYVLVPTLVMVQQWGEEIGKFPNFDQNKANTTKGIHTCKGLVIEVKTHEKITKIDAKYKSLKRDDSLKCDTVLIIDEAHRNFQRVKNAKSDQLKQLKKNKLKTNINKKFKKISLFELQNSPKFLNFRVRA